jgi:tRNA pseudouridine38-40 synthase
LPTKNKTVLRYFFHIAYKGTNYRGWQKQITANSVQEKLEELLSDFLKEKVHCIGCGRTDAGVHASEYYFHIDTNKAISKELLFPLNRMLPKDIAIYDIIEVQDRNHAQHSAIERTYNYFIHFQKNPFLNNISSLYNTCVDIKEMQRAVQSLIGEHDFRAYCKTPDRHNHTICAVKSAQLFTDSKNQYLRFEISANRFLKGMIRILMQNLLDIGNGKMSADEFVNILASKQERRNLKLAYPQGLYLSDIKYDFIKKSSQSDFCPLLTMIDWKPVCM